MMTSPVGNVYIHLFQVEWFDVSPLKWRLHNIRDSFWRFYLHEHDGAFYHFNGRDYSLKAGRLYLIPAGVQFSSGSERALKQFYIHFDVLGLPEVILRELFAVPLCLPPHRALHNKAQNVASQAGKQGTDALNLHLQIKAFLYEMLANYLLSIPESKLAHCHAMSASLKPVQPALRYIEDHIGSDLSNGVLARCCHMGESHFIRTFSACTGHSPAQYVAAQRVRIAAQRLLFSQHSIERVALETGFGNRHYFTRVFTRHIGQPPAAYRKSARVWQAQHTKNS